MLAFVVILSIAVALAAVIVSIIIFIRLYRYRKAKVNDRLIIKYHDYLRRKKKNILSKGKDELQGNRLLILQMPGLWKRQEPD